MKKSHMKLQQVGEVENERAVSLARSSTEGRKMIKQFGKRHDLSKGDDPRSHDKHLDSKRKRFEGGGGVHGKFREKSERKMQEKSRPTRSKLIVKGGYDKAAGFAGGRRGGFRGDQRGRSDRGGRGGGSDRGGRRGGHGGRGGGGRDGGRGGARGGRRGRR